MAESQHAEVNAIDLASTLQSLHLGTASQGR